MRTLVLVPALFLIAAVSGEGAERARIELSRAPKPPVIDGVLDDEAWQSPLLALSEWITYNPLNGEKLPQRTDVHATYDDRYLYFAFHCLDPEPDKVRSTMSRRDQMWNDDWVGLSPLPARGRTPLPTGSGTAPADAPTRATTSRCAFPSRASAS